MMSYTLVKWIGTLALISALLGCSQEDIERWANRETYEFHGTYDNQYNSDLLIFEDGIVSTRSDSQTWSRPYTVDGTQISIQVRNNSKEQREDIVMVIHGQGEVLTCSVCAMYKLSNVWTKIGYVEAKMPSMESTSQ